VYFWNATGNELFKVPKSGGKQIILGGNDEPPNAVKRKYGD
jgi:hypothetical protein